MATLADIVNPHASQRAPAGGGTMDRPNTLGSLLGKKGEGIWPWLGVLGDALAVWGGGRPGYIPAREARLADERALQQRYDLAEYEGRQRRSEKKWEWANKPADKPALQETYEYLESIDPEAAKNYLSRQTNDTLWRPAKDGQFYPYDPTPSVDVLGPELPQGWTIDPPANIPSGNPLAPNLNAILEDARMRGRNYMGGR